MAKRDVVEKPEDHSFVQDCGSGWGMAGEPEDPSFNDVALGKWTRGGMYAPGNFDTGNAWRGGKLRE
jgi:hypothetical protein